MNLNRLSALFWIVITLSALLVACNVEQQQVPTDEDNGASAPTSEVTDIVVTQTPESWPSPTQTVEGDNGATPDPIETADAVVQETRTPTPIPTEITATPEEAQTETSSAPPPDALVVDHTSVADFERIPDEFLVAAQELRMTYLDRSVGSNINDGLDCLSYADERQAPSYCSRFEHNDPAFSGDPDVEGWSRPGGYERSNWTFQSYSPDCASSNWSETVECFMQMMDSSIENYDVVSFQFTYLDVVENSTIANMPGGFFWDNADITDVYDLEAFEAQYPDKVFIYWTTSLARSIGTAESETFNNQMRQYAIENDKPLFDVADILSHDPVGNPCYDNRDGIRYDDGNNIEDFADDGHNYLAICPHYTTETEGGHLGSVSTGMLRTSKAFWVLMARIAGWDG